MSDKLETSAHLKAAHKREVDALKQRLAELNAEVAAKDAVIMWLNDALAEEQRRKMATTEKSLVVGDAAKLPKTVDLRFDICQNIELVLKIGRDYQNKDGYRGAHYDTVKLLCDAIEYQQEQLKAKTEVGNVAKLREAAVKIIDYLEPIRKWTMPTQENGTELTTLFAAVDTVYQIARAALAAPPRNCNRFSTWEEANKAFEKENAHRIGFMNLYTDVLKWLFATAKEGGANA